jgi:lipid-binding SYLF domain-containing protein
LYRIIGLDVARSLPSLKRPVFFASLPVFENAKQVVHEIMGMPDKGIPEEVLEHAKCIAVVPHMVKGGFVFGGKGGKGVATCRTSDGWSAPAFITISGGSWGLQIGVEAVDVVLIIQNEKGIQKLLESNFQIGADASAAAVQLDGMPRLVRIGSAVAEGKAEAKSEAKEKDKK